MTLSTSTSTSTEIAEELVSRYLTAHSQNDLEAVLALFEEGAIVEDPVGSPVHQGGAAIHRFYAETHSTNGPMTIEREGPVLVAGDEIAVHVRAGLDKPGAPPPMDVIYVIRLSPSRQIASLRAWF